MRGPGRRIEWAVAGTLAGLAIARLTGADRLRVAESWTVGVLSFTPQLAAGAGVSALVLRRNGPAVVAAIAGGALAATVIPRATRSRQPAATGPLLRILTANLLAGRGSADALAELAARKDADVVFVQELTDGAAGRLHRAGLSAFLPHTTGPGTSPGRLGSTIYSRFPLLAAAAPVAGPSAARATARLTLPTGQVVRLICVHAQPPKPPWSPAATARWRGQLSALPPPGADPVILAGDFNSTVDHAAFRRLLALGYADAAGQVGRGLALTWGPRPHLPPALLAIDHVLVSRPCAVLATSTHVLPGSDHRAVYAEVRLPR